MQALDLRIRVHGWALVQVQDESTVWSYTVGLVENYDHPELTLLDADLDVASWLINRLVDDIAARGELSAGLVRKLGVQCVEVHDDHLHSDLFGTWSNRYGCLVPPGDMLQVLLPDCAYCDGHAHVVRRLDRPGPTPPPPPPLLPPNREERRRRGRGGHAA